jgi:hypothetical protein
MNATFLNKLKIHCSWRKPWLWLALLFGIYSLGLGLVAPRVLEGQLQSLVRERLQLELKVEDISVNPFTLELRARNLIMRGGELPQPLGFGELLVNFQLSSLWRRAWSFQEVHLLGVFGEFQRAKDGSSNISRIGDTWLATAPPEEPEAPAADISSALPRLRIADLQLQIAGIQIHDQVPDTAFATQVGPVDLRIKDLSTLLDHKGQQQFSLTTPAGLRLDWQGDISLAPFASSGSIRLRGPVFTLATQYLQDAIQFVVPEGNQDTQFNYSLVRNSNFQWRIALTEIQSSITQLQVLHKSDQSPLLNVQSLNLAQGSLHWPEQTVELPVIELSGGELWSVLHADGQLNLSQLMVPAATVPTTAASTTDPTPAEPWTIKNPLLRLQDWTIHWSDRTLLQPADITLQQFQLEIAGFSTEPHSRIQVQNRFLLGEGQVHVSGTLQPLPLANLDLAFNINALPLQLAQPYLADQALVNLGSGILVAEGKIAAQNLEQLTLTGNFKIDDLLITEQNSGKKILGWTQLALEELALATDSPITLSIKKVLLDKPYVDFAVTEDGTHTINHILRPVTPTPATEAVAPEPTPDPLLQIGRVVISNGGGVFSDASLPLPFSAQIQNLNGTVSTLDSSSRTPAKIQLKGQVGQYGQVQITGRLLPLKLEQNTKIAMQFENVDIPDFSPYAMKFAAREIASGKLDLDLDYELKDSKMLGENNLVLHDFELGKAIDHPGALDLPLDLALALLKDSSGKITLDLPVSGNMDDPQFNYGKVIGQALRKVLTSIVSAPFRLLGKLAGSESKQFGRVVFVPGSDEVSPPQQEKIHQLAAILQQRPDLLLEIPAGYSTSRDTSPMRTQQFLQKVQLELDEELDLLEEHHLKVLENFYESQQLTPPLPDLRQKYTRIPEGKTAPELDQLAYGTNLRNALVKTETLPEGALVNLGAVRQTHIHQVLLAAAPELAERVTLTPGGEMPGKEKEKKVYVELGLKTLDK